MLVETAVEARSVGSCGPACASSPARYPSDSCLIAANVASRAGRGAGALAGGSSARPCRVRSVLGSRLRPCSAGRPGACRPALRASRARARRPPCPARSLACRGRLWWWNPIGPDRPGEERNKGKVVFLAHADPHPPMCTIPAVTVPGHSRVTGNWSHRGHTIFVDRGAVTSYSVTNSENGHNCVRVLVTKRRLHVCLTGTHRPERLEDAHQEARGCMAVGHPNC